MEIDPHPLKLEMRPRRRVGRDKRRTSLRMEEQPLADSVYRSDAYLIGGSLPLLEVRLSSAL